MVPDNLVVLGRIGKAYGVKGWVKIQSYTQPIENIVNYQPWLIHHKKQWRSIEVEASRTHGEGLITKFAEIDNPEMARAYVNCELAVSRERLPKLEADEYYWNDLHGLRVVTKEGINLGVVDHLLATGSNDVLVIVGEKEHLIPFLLEQFVLSVDLTKKEIVVDWDPEF